VRSSPPVNFSYYSNWPERKRRRRKRKHPTNPEPTPARKSPRKERKPRIPDHLPVIEEIVDPEPVKAQPDKARP